MLARAALLTALAAGAIPCQLIGQDSAAIRQEMRRTAADYERSLRRAAPYRVGGSSGQCDEIVGRFCLTYDAGTGQPLPPEPPPIKQARARAIDAYEKGFAIWPADTLVAGPLVRYLVEHDERLRALEMAERFAAANQDPVWSGLLVGFALHQVGRDTAAEGSFDRALAGMRSDDRERWQDVRVVLSFEEQSRYRALPISEREEFEQRLWRLADPLYLTPGNEARNEHFARHLYGRILRRAPFAMGAVSWGSDVEELNLRFGVPRARTQDYGRGVSTEMQITEHFDPDQQTYIPPALLTKPGITEFEPGAVWPYDTIRSRSGYSPFTVRRMRILDHALSRFHQDDSVVVRIDAVLPFDSAVTLPTRVEFGLFLLDSMFRVVAFTVDTVAAGTDSVVASLVLRLNRNAVAYSVEARELSSRLASRARHWLPAPLPVARPLLSDLVPLRAGAEALPESRQSLTFKPLPSLSLERGQAMAIYLEVVGLTPDDERMVRYSVDLEVMEQSRPGVFTRAVHRLGRALGLGGDDISPRITWNEQKPAAVAVPIALNLGRLQLDRGLKRLRVTVTDRETGVKSAIERVVRVER